MYYSSSLCCKPPQISLFQHCDEGQLECAQALAAVGCEVAAAEKGGGRTDSKR